MIQDRKTHEFNLKFYNTTKFYLLQFASEANFAVNRQQWNRQLIFLNISKN